MKWVYKNEITPAIFVIIGILIFGLIYIGNEQSSYQKDGVIVNALVTGHQYDYRGRIEIYYQFLAGTKIIFGNTSFPELKGGAEKYLMGRYLPVIYINENPEINELLASPIKFKKLSIPIPDSLLWLKRIERSW